jgi:exopolyphosphatase / guanosine-5'-triphosphate,3'-diphosphate pyrophosphatase
MNVAAIDIGTNSVRLLINDAQGRELAREMRITRLGQGVDVAGSLHADAIERTVAVLADYKKQIDQHAAKRVRATATSAARDAKNSQDFFDAAERALGHRPELIGGEEEAELSFRGATEGLKEAGPYLVIDIGGGSTEFVLGSQHPEQVISVNMGCVRMAERHLKSDPATREQLEAAFADTRKLLVEVRKKVDVTRARTVVGLAGTITALAYLHRGLKTYSPADTHRTWLSRADVEAAFEKLAHANVEQRRELLVEPKRAEVIVGGAAVLVTLMREFAIDRLLVSECDILDGIAASLRD